MEKLLVIEGLPTYIVVSDTGHAYNCKTGQEVKYYKNSNDYLSFSCRARNGHNFGLIQLHRVVALMYVENPDPEVNKTVDHKDGDKSHNWADNLEWVPYSENMRRSYERGLRTPLKPEQVSFTKYTREQVTAACELLQAGESVQTASDKTGIDRKNLYDIRNGHLWKDVTCNYTFPVDEYRRMQNCAWTPEIRKKAEALLQDGMKPGEVRDTLEVPYLYKHIQDWSYRLRKAQRLEKDSQAS